MPHNHDLFAHLRHLPLADIEEEVRRSLLSNYPILRPERKPCAKIDIPMRHDRNPEASRDDSQITKTCFSLNIGENLRSLRLSQEALDSINEQLRRNALQRLEQNLRQLYISLGHVRQLAEAEQCVASVERTANVSLSDAFEMCDRFLSQHNMPWELLSQLITNGLVRQLDGELVLVVQVANPLMLRDGQIAARFAVSRIDMGRVDRSQSRFIGDETCEYNARSPYVRCAVNPCGPCEGCVHRERND